MFCLRSGLNMTQYSFKSMEPHCDCNYSCSDCTQIEFKFELCWVMQSFKICMPYFFPWLTNDVRTTSRQMRIIQENVWKRAHSSNIFLSSLAFLQGFSNGSRLYNDVSRCTFYRLARNHCPVKGTNSCTFFR